MKRIFILMMLICSVFYGNSQATYNSTNFAVSGDTEYLTKAAVDTFKFTKTGANQTWDYSKLFGYDQTSTLIRDPKNTGYTAAQWPFINNAANTNLSSYDGTTLTVSGASQTNKNDYYLKSTGALLQKASGYTLSFNGFALNIKNQFTAPDSLYKFPINYKDSFTSHSSYATSVAGFYYNKETVSRKTKVEGWGKLITPFGTFNNCLRIVSDVVQFDSFSVTGFTIPNNTFKFRKIEWLDPSKGFPVLIVIQNSNGATTSIQYLDVKKNFTPKAFCLYNPIKPSTSTPVVFQNLTLNANKYYWNFGDGPAIDSVNKDPSHTYTSEGTYAGYLIGLNTYSNKADTFNFVITVANKPFAVYSYSPFSITTCDTIRFNNLSQRAVSYKWIFENTGKSTDTSTAVNPTHIYATSNVYTPILIATNAAGSDTFSFSIAVTICKPVASFSFKPLTANTCDTVKFKSTSLRADSTIWDFGDGTPLSYDSSHRYTVAGTYIPKLIVKNNTGNDTAIGSSIVITACTVPVKLISFSANKTKLGNQLIWSTTSNSTALSYIIERSTDGIHFTSISSVSANKTNKYQYTDATSSVGAVYYRLRFVEATSFVSYSSVVKVSSTSIEASSISVYPNPVTSSQDFKLNVQSVENKNVQIQIVGIDGKIVATQKATIVAGSNLISLNSNTLKQGVYFVKCISDENATIATTKFIVTE